MEPARKAQRAAARVELKDHIHTILAPNAKIAPSKLKIVATKVEKMEHAR